MTEELVSRAIQSGSPDNVTLIICDVAELYARYQRSTPFQGQKKGTRSVISPFGGNFGGHIPSASFSNHKSKSKKKIRNQDKTRSVFSTNIFSTMSSWQDEPADKNDSFEFEKGKLFEFTKNQDDVDVDMSLFAKPEKKSSSNPFSKPNISLPNTNMDMQNRRSEIINRRLTQSKRHSQQGNF